LLDGAARRDFVNFLGFGRGGRVSAAKEQF
jgi:hypothetical protein